jgi:hypothetical protein
MQSPRFSDVAEDRDLALTFSLTQRQDMRAYVDSLAFSTSPSVPVSFHRPWRGSSRWTHPPADHCSGEKLR